MFAYLLPLIAWVVLLTAILRDAAAYNRAHPTKPSSAHGAGKNVLSDAGH